MKTIARIAERDQTYYGRDTATGGAPKYGTSGTATQVTLFGQHVFQSGGFKDSKYATQKGKYRESDYATPAMRDPTGTPRDGPSAAGRAGRGVAEVSAGSAPGAEAVDAAKFRARLLAARAAGKADAAPCKLALSFHLSQVTHI